MVENRVGICRQEELFEVYKVFLEENLDIDEQILGDS